MADYFEAFPDWVRVQSVRTNRLADKSTVGSAHLAVVASRVSAVSWLQEEIYAINHHMRLEVGRLNQNYWIRTGVVWRLLV